MAYKALSDIVVIIHRGCLPSDNLMYMMETTATCWYLSNEIEEYIMRIKVW